ncbi:MAG: PAS domain-containing hybrid sensor histidine kinase/response regulator [Hyphomicrobiales bacterium]
MMSDLLATFGKIDLTSGLAIALISLVYMGFLFLVATYGDRQAGSERWLRWRPTIYALSIAVYCTSWTFFGSVGVAARSGFDFLAIYICPVLLVTVGYPLLRRIIRLSKEERITSIADFLASRYGKRQSVAVIATLIAVIGTVPYIALQLKALSTSVAIMVSDQTLSNEASIPFFSDLPLLIAISMAAFAILFGARHTDATEHQNGLMLAVATESVIKLVAFLAVGIYVTWFMFDGPGDLYQQGEESGVLYRSLIQEQGDGLWISFAILSFGAFFILPRQFHVMVVESNGGNESRRAIWLFPLYLILINLFVAPIALAGLLSFDTAVNEDSFVLALPLSHGADFISIVAFLGGLSAATAMVIVATVALAIMVSNDIVVPWIVRRSSNRVIPYRDMYGLILNIRRGAIFLIILLAYVYYRVAGDTAALVSIGILSFAAAAQLAPAFFGGLFWKRATSRGAIASMGVGFLLWAYTLILPTFVDSGLIDPSILANGPFGIEALKPRALFGTEFSPLMHGTLWSLGVNSLLFVVVSLMTTQSPIERLQSDVFVARSYVPSHVYKRWHTPIKVGELQDTVGHYLGQERVARSFDRFARENSLVLNPDNIADVPLLRFAEQLLASAIGASSARLVMTLLISRQRADPQEAVQLLDEATAAIQYNRELLQVAIDEVEQGLAVFDSDLRLTCWNRNFRTILDLPVEFGEVGTSLGRILRHMAEAGEFGLGSIEGDIASRIASYSGSTDVITERLAIARRAVEVRTKPMPEGGFVLSINDITNRILNEEALTRSNETLEARVRTRTEELMYLNSELTDAKAEADDANIGKTRFLAAAGHDILQPLNAARLYATTLADRATRDGDQVTEEYVQKINASLGGVEDILGAVLDIGRLDTGALKPRFAIFAIQDVFDQLEVEFAPQAMEKDLSLTISHSAAFVNSDERLLRRLLQNLISNAIKYTETGKVLVAAKGSKNDFVIEVTDTGQGIAETHRGDIFREFHRLEDGARAASGLGLGLSIVERISKVLNHPIEFESELGQGSKFSVGVKSVAKPANIDKASKELVAPSPVSAQLNGLVILCIDNEPEILKGMRSMLSGWDCTVLTADSLKNALDVIDEHGDVPDGIIADYHLDVGTGIDVIEECRNRHRADLPSILLTADRSRAVQNTAEERAILVLRKPLKPAALRALLSQWRLTRVAAE